MSHYYREPHPYFRRRVLVVGGKNSAAEAALELYRAGARVTLVHHAAELSESIKYWVKPDIDNRIKAGAIRAHFSSRVIAISPTHVTLDTPAGERLRADHVYLMTGYRAETTLLRSVGAVVDEAIHAPAHDEATFETAVPNRFVVGACIAGKQSGTIFIENGRFHGEVAVKTIAERFRMNR